MFRSALHHPTKLGTLPSTSPPPLLKCILEETQCLVLNIKAWQVKCVPSHKNKTRKAEEYIV